MKIFLDFDDTLIDKEQFYFKFYVPLLLQETGISQQKIDEAYKSFFIQSSDKKVFFSPKEHMYRLGMADTRIKELVQKVDEHLLEKKAYLFLGAQELLGSLQDNVLYLLTFGDLEFQKQKIQLADIKNFFTEIITTEGDKVQEVGQRLDGSENFIFIDDKTEHFTRLKEKLHEQARLIHMCHNDGNTCVGCTADAHAHNFEELTQEIRKLCVE